MIARYVDDFWGMIVSRRGRAVRLHDCDVATELHR
jgi:hypothetical protein